jgi:hypothetical protein
LRPEHGLGEWMASGSEYIGLGLRLGTPLPLGDLARKSRILFSLRGASGCKILILLFYLQNIWNQRFAGDFRRHWVWPVPLSMFAVSHPKLFAPFFNYRELEG